MTIQTFFFIKLTLNNPCTKDENEIWSFYEAFLNLAHVKICKSLKKDNIHSDQSEKILKWIGYNDWHFRRFSLENMIWKEMIMSPKCDLLCECTLCFSLIHGIIMPVHGEVFFCTKHVKSLNSYFMPILIGM